MIQETLKSKLKEYMKAGDTQRLGVLRYFLSLITNKEIELRGTDQSLTDEMVYKIVKKQIKNRKENIETYEKARREDLLEQEKNELQVWEEFAQLFPQPVD